MTVRKLTATGDMSFGNSLKDFLVDSPEAVAQVVLTSLRLWLGEWSFDTSLGMPWIEDVIGKHDQSVSDLAIQNYISSIQGVTEIVAYTSAQDRVGRRFVVSLEILTEFSQTPIQALNQNNF